MKKYIQTIFIFLISFNSFGQLPDKIINRKIRDIQKQIQKAEKSISQSRSENKKQTRNRLTLGIETINKMFNANIKKHNEDFLKFLDKKRMSKKTLQRMIDKQGIINHYYKEKIYSIIDYVDGYDIPINKDSEKTIDQARNKGISDFESIYDSDILETDKTIARLKYYKEDPRNYFDVHKNKYEDYVELREKLYETKEKNILTLINKSIDAKIEIWQ